MDLPVHTPPLVDALAKSHENPDTFEYPVRERPLIGEYVKVCDGKERFWVQVIAVEYDEGSLHDTKLIGRVDNHLISGQRYSYPALIAFQARHIYQLYKD